ncbi:protein involved in carbohydrate transport [Arthrobacter sp. Hiyo6]|nr:protein involved in carbohydrate transport [Arthrobacter sp. Hiyo6]
MNFLELLYSAGGDVIDNQGNVKVDSPETRSPRLHGAGHQERFC